MKPDPRLSGQHGGRSTSPRKGETARDNGRRVRVRELSALYPFLGRRGWTLAEAIEAGRRMGRLLEGERAPIAILLDQDGIPPVAALEVLDHLLTLDPVARAEIVTQAQSADRFERNRALARAAGNVDPLDPSVGYWNEARRALLRGAKSCRVPPFAGRATELAEAVRELLNDLLRATGGHPQ